ncbi:mitochondrial protein Pet127-domain-containing protein [Collybia nuda]|uniref:Mitochondrial protein Pet127-domain-containing protein n=1 Tax=Collybia nuda TaxID=64659 RepID=A0A9P5YH75_9AGAR|nr:mitochondrial protein Pet127-domain-containing protein [Collybia nuda]
MSIWGHVSQRLQAPVRCIATTTTTGTTTTHTPKSKPITKEEPSPLPHPPFDVVKHLKSNSEADILGLNKPTHRLASQEVVEAALARAHSAGEVILETLKNPNNQIQPRWKDTTRETGESRDIENFKKRGPPPWKKPRDDSHNRLHSSPNFRNRLSSHQDGKRTLDGGGVRNAVGRREKQPWGSEGWGEDKLRPPTGRHSLTEHAPNPVKAAPRDSTLNFESSSHNTRPHRSPLFYERRIEGLLDPSNKRALEDLKPNSKHLPIAQLAHGLERVLFNPGVHWLQDPRSRVYNFPPYLENIPKVNDFAFERLSGFIKSSRDEDLWDLAKRENRPFAGSTSSLTGILSQIYFLISGNRNVDTSVLSNVFAREPKSFTPGQRMPSSVLFNYKDGVYAIDSAGDPALADKNILTWLGTLLEKFLTMTPEAFSTYMRSEKPLPVEGTQTEDPTREAYRYAKSGRFVMRSQLDCEDKRLPGTGVFDIKTRACLPIRMDLLNYKENSGYLIRKQYGTMESFEKEYFDLIRSAFLKYSFQVRIGNMDGVIVAYHNTARMFGFQYIPLEEMDQRLFGSKPGVGDRVFDKCVSLMEQVAEEVVRCFPKQSVRCTFETEDNADVMNVWIEPAEWNSDKPRPIKQLEVRVKNYIRESPMRGYLAVSSGDEAWTTHWSIGRLSGKDHNPRDGLMAAQARQFRAYNIPTGIDPADMAEFWNGLDFGGRTKFAQGTGEGNVGNEAHGAPYMASNFRQPSGSVQRLRKVARAGREETERLREEERRKPMWVLGEAEPVPRDVIDAVLETHESGVTPGVVIVEDGTQEGDMEPQVTTGEPVDEAQLDLEGVELETVTSSESDNTVRLGTLTSGKPPKGTHFSEHDR